ncbi:MAG: Holliday junction branch migration protein RuvA [Clostridia bacterium]|nr:Holliday junction branch migration protein RuvA [Clostridia bacterium]
MFAYINGKLEVINDDNVVVDVNGIGYRIFVSSYSLSRIGKIGEQIKLYTYLHVKEDALTVFGFSSKQELMLFEKLISVNRVGPKIALNFLSTLSPDQIIMAITSNDLKTLTSLPGVGKKTAQRIMLELKDKLDMIDLNDNNASGLENVNQSHCQEAVQALVNLGYSQNDARKMIDDVKEDYQDVEDLIKAALKRSI